MELIDEALSYSPPESRLLVPGIGRVAYRVHQAHAIAEEFGVAKTVSAISGRFLGENNEIKIEWRNQKLRHPLHLRPTYSDLWGYIELFCQDAYTIPEYLDERVDGNVIIDIGAYNGASAAYFATRYPDSKVYAIEPNPDNYELLEKNTRPYGKQIEIIKAAASPSNHGAYKRPLGTHKRSLGLKPDNMLNAYMPKQSANGDGEEVPSISPYEIKTLRASSKLGRIGILKVDIEGAEKSLFESSEIDPLLQLVEILLIETHDIYVPGSKAAVQAAAIRNGLSPLSFNKHTDIYSR